MTDETNPQGNQINFWGKLSAGILLIVLTTSAILLAMAYWPNKMPPAGQGDDGAWYTNNCFNVTLIEAVDTSKENDSSYIKAIDAKIMEWKKDSAAAKKDSIAFMKKMDSLQNLKKAKSNSCCEHVTQGKRIHLNTILLLLVALMGFLGNMIHVASSLTSFVGNGTFKRSWVLWYFVKPFTAAALALVVYFVIRAGFLSYGTGASGVSLYGIMALSALAGLFTDNATLKLKEVFDVIFKPKDERTGKLEGDEVTVASFSPDSIAQTGESTLTVMGKNLNAAGLKITMGDAVVTTATKTAEKLEIKYTATPAAIAAGKVYLLITDNTGKQVYSKDILIK